MSFTSLSLRTSAPAPMPPSYQAPDLSKVRDNMREARENWCRRLKEAGASLGKRVPFSGGKGDRGVGPPAVAKRGVK
jgi:hypothetical protein